MAALTEGLPVVYNSVVKEVLYSKKGVAVRTATQEFQGTFPPHLLVNLAQFSSPSSELIVF